jgi:hypothetical protein
MTSFHRESAKIYQFPARARRALDGQHEGTRSGENAAVTNPTALRVTDAAFGGAWYHEEAVQEADRPGRS